VSAPAPVFEVRNLQVIRGGSLILNVPKLTVADGEILSIIGPNGAGKSTLLQTLAALVKPSCGEVFFRGQRVGVEIPQLAYRRKLAMILQEPLLFDTTVYNNVASGLKLRGMRKQEVEPIVVKSLERFGIAHLRDRSARNLSGGEARRASIARAFATDPEVLLLDEPFSALDPLIREALMEDLEEVLRETRITTIFVTHDRQEALRLSNRLGVMNAGEILQEATPEEILNRPVNEFVASLVGVETILSAEIVRRGQGTLVASVSGQEIEATGDMHSGEQVLLCIRPENIALSSAGSGASTQTRNAFLGRIKKITPLWLHKKVQLDCGFPVVAYVPNHSLTSFSLREGMEVTVSFRPADVGVIPSRSCLEYQCRNRGSRENHPKDVHLAEKRRKGCRRESHLHPIPVNVQSKPDGDREK
jgi:tungstate transport system ATP-binding protein